MELETNASLYHQVLLESEYTIAPAGLNTECVMQKAYGRRAERGIREIQRGTLRFTSCFLSSPIFLLSLFPIYMTSHTHHFLIYYLSRCYRFYEAFASGSTPIIEDVQVPACKHHPLTLLREMRAPAIYVKDWLELPAILEKASLMTPRDLYAQRCEEDSMG